MMDEYKQAMIDIFREVDQAVKSGNDLSASN